MRECSATGVSVKIRVKMTRLIRKPEAPTIPNLTKCRTPRRCVIRCINSAAFTSGSRDPVPVREQDREEPEERKRERDDRVVHPRACAPQREDREHWEKDERETRHAHQARRAQRSQNRKRHVR